MTNARNLANRSTDFVSVRDFGARGDGVTDDTAAIQAALNSGATNVYLPAGQFKVTPQSNSRALAVPDGVNFYGDPSSSELYMVTAAGNDPGVSVDWDVVLFTGSRTKWSSIRGIRIRHSGGSRNNCASIAVRSNCTRVTIENCDIADSIANAIAIEGSVATPYATYAYVLNNKIANCIRHGVYLSGATDNLVQQNYIETSRLEAIVIRNAGDNDILENRIVGDGAAYPPHGIAMAQPASGVYTIKRLRIRGNRVTSIPGSAFYGQGVGATITNCDISGNVFNGGLVGAAPGAAFYRTSHSTIADNQVYGGRNRGMTFYGCQYNEVIDNTIVDTNTASATAGALLFIDYTDPADSTTTYSTGNTVAQNSILDNRGTALHVYGIQFAAGSNANTVGANEIIGLTSSKYVAGDSWSTFKLPAGDTHQWYYNDIASGNTAQTQCPVIGDTFLDTAMATGWLKSLTIVARQTMTSGTITAQLYKNGSLLTSVVLTGDGSATIAAAYYMPTLYAISPEDKLTAFFVGASVVTGTPVDILIKAQIATAE